MYVTDESNLTLFFHSPKELKVNIEYFNIIFSGRFMHFTHLLSSVIAYIFWQCGVMCNTITSLDKLTITLPISDCYEKNYVHK